MSVQESVETENADIDELLTGLVRFFLRNSAQGAFDLEWVMREVGKAYGVTAHVLIQVEGAVVSVTHADGSQFTAVVRVSPELERLDLVSESKRLVNQIVAGELSPRAAGQMLSDLQRSPDPYPTWLRFVGVVLFAAGFAPIVQATWREVGTSVVLGVVMAVVFIGGERIGRLRLLLPLIGPLIVGVIAFELLDADHAPGGPVLAMVPALFLWIPGDSLCGGTAELAVGLVTPGAVRLAQAAFTLFEIAAGVVAAAQLTDVGTGSLFESKAPPTLPDWFIVLSWIVFTLGIALTFSARIRDYPWMVALTYLVWGVQLGITKIVGPGVGTFAAGAVLAIAGGLLDQSRRLPPRVVLIIGGFYALTVGSVALRGLTIIDGGQRIQGFHDLRDAITQTLALTTGLTVGVLSVEAFLTRVLGRDHVRA